MIKFDLKNRVAVVTGGAQGFGLAITERFIEAGAKVIIWDIDENLAKKTTKKFKSYAMYNEAISEKPIILCILTPQKQKREYWQST